MWPHGIKWYDHLRSAQHEKFRRGLVVSVLEAYFLCTFSRYILDGSYSVEVTLCNTKKLSIIHILILPYRHIYIYIYIYIYISKLSVVKIYVICSQSLPYFLRICSFKINSDRNWPKDCNGMTIRIIVPQNVLKWIIIYQ